MPAACTPPAAGAPPAPCIEPVAAASWVANPFGCAVWRTTSLRWYGPPFGPRVVWALARFSAVTSMRRRSALRPLPEMSIASKRPMWSPSLTDADRGLDDLDARLGDAHERLVLEPVLRHGGGLGVDVDAVAVGAHRLRVLLRREARGLDRGGVGRAHRLRERVVEVDVHAPVAGRLGVREVIREHALAQRRAGDGALQAELGVVDQGHREGSGHCTRECFVRPWTSLRPPSVGVTPAIGLARASFSPPGRSAPAETKDDRGRLAITGKGWAGPHAAAKPGAADS